MRAWKNLENKVLYCRLFIHCYGALGGCIESQLMHSLHDVANDGVLCPSASQKGRRVGSAI